MTEHPSRQILMLMFPHETFRVLATKLDKELTMKTRVTDRVMRLKTKSGERGEYVSEFSAARRTRSAFRREPRIR